MADYTYSAAHGLKIYGGRTAPSQYPAWRANAPLNAWMQIPGTDGATIHATKPSDGSIELNAYCGWADCTGGKFVIAAPGGHVDGNDNSVVGIDLSQDAPAWTRLHVKSSDNSLYVAGSGAPPYLSDGTPYSRHLYQSAYYIASLNRVMLFGCMYPAGSSDTMPQVDGFNLTNNSWDPAGTYPSCINGKYGAFQDGNGDVWGTGGNTKFTVSTQTWSTPLTTSAAKQPRWPWAYDSTRAQMFGLCYGDGQGSSISLGVVAAVQKGNVQTQIAFNSSAALTQFIADAPMYAGMVYVPSLDVFLFYDGRGSTVGRIYVITPNSGTTWDISLFSYAAGATAPLATHSGGLNGRFTYVPALGGIVMLPIGGAGDNLYFLRLV